MGYNTEYTGRRAANIVSNISRSFRSVQARIEFEKPISDSKRSDARDALLHWFYNDFFFFFLSFAYEFSTGKSVSRSSHSRPPSCGSEFFLGSPPLFRRVVLRFSQWFLTARGEKSIVNKLYLFFR